MTEMKMRERVARAICLAEKMNPDDKLGGWRHWTEVANAAMAEMRDPTAPMIKAGVHLVQGWGVSGIPVWEAMINAALAEPQP